MRADPARPGNTWERVLQLPPEVLVANYHVGLDWVNLFVIRAGEIHPYRIPLTRLELPRLDGLAPGRSRGLGAPSTSGLPDNSPLIEPIIEHAEGASLIYLVPHGPLEHYPLHAMAMGGKRLIDYCPVIYLPCLSMMPPAEPAPVSSWQALVMGNMTMDLSGAAGEAEAVARLFGTKAYVGEEATLKRLFSEAPGKNILHIAGHGFFDPSQPLASGIPFPDGILTVRHVYEELKLDNCLVVLSGCVTGLGDERPGEGFSSLIGAFFSAGARGLLVSLWNVDDAATTEFMIGVYQRVLAQGSSFPLAFQGSYMDLRRVSEAQHVLSAPFYWAPFKPVGSW